MSTYSGIFGLFCLVQERRIPLPLTKVSVDAKVIDLTAAVTLTQTYHHQDSSSGTVEAAYLFPLPARSAVNSFVLIKEDGQRVVGVVQEKEEARETYEKAVTEGKLASLMVQHTPDAFQVKVGNILPGETIRVELCYITELTEDEENDSARFIIPTYISQRYGHLPGNPATSGVTAASSGAVSSTYLQLRVALESVAPIAKIGSPSHTVTTELGPDPGLANAKELPFSNYARVDLTADAALDKDFVLTFRSSGLDAPRCLAEVHPGEKHETVAFALTVVPRFKLPDVPKQEFIFLVDRSGSMGGWGGSNRITTARKALVVMLRSLPHKDSTVNIVSFGSSHSSLWPASRAYDAKTLDEATAHVDQMQADMGGTEIRVALESVFKTRQTDRPTSVFVLTDGDAWDLDATLAAVQRAVDDGSEEAYLRVFSLGIGNSASTALVEGIARIGNGSASFVNDTETFAGKTTRLLKAARSPLLRNVRVAWGLDGAVGVDAGSGVESGKNDDGFELLSSSSETDTLASEAPTPKKISLFDSESDEPLISAAERPPAPVPVNLPAPRPIQQSPFKIRNISPANRLYVYAILSPPAWKKGDPLPKSVFLRGSLQSSDEVELEIPVTLTQLSQGLTAPPPIHTMAARKIIQDLEDGRHELTGAELDTDTLSKTVEAAIVRLGQTYSLVSKHTSFVVVDEDDSKVRPTNRLSAGNAEVSRSPATERRGLMPMPMGGSTFGSGGTGRASSTFSGGAAAFGLARTTAVPRSTPISLPPPPPAPAPGAYAERHRSLAAEPHTVKHKVRSSAPFGFGSAPIPSYSSAPPGGFGGAPPTMLFGMTAPSEKAAPIAVPKPFSEQPNLTDADRLDALARQQEFDGAFNVAVVTLCSTLNAPAAEVVAKLPDSIQAALGTNAEKVVATLVALIYLGSHLSKEQDAWEAVAEKAKDFVEGLLVEAKLDLSFEELKALLQGLWAA